MPALALFQPEDENSVGDAIAIVTVRDLFRVYLERTSDQMKPKVLRERKRLLERFSDRRGNSPISELIPDDLEGWIEVTKSWESDWMKLRVAASIKRPFNWATRKGLIACNPFLSVTYPTGPRGHPISQEDFRLMVRSTPSLFRRVLLFMSWTGTRPCELSSLEWAHIDIANGSAIMHLHKTSRSRKDRAPRVIYLPDVAVRLLIWVKRKQKEGEKFVFLNSHKKKWTTGSLDFRVWRLREKTGIDRSVKLYGCRHAWATNLAMNGVGLVELAALLGHTTVAMAQYYVHVAGKTSHLRSVLERGLNSKGKRS